MNVALPRFDAFEVLRSIEKADYGGANQTLATLETLAVIPQVSSTLRDKILCLTDDDWCEIEERSGIIQYDCGVPCDEAEMRALLAQVSKGG